jgi:hypothetical protein
MAITSLFGPTPAELIFAQQQKQREEQLLRNQQITQQGAEFGPFRGLYQAGLRMGDIGGQAIMQGLFPDQVDPRLQEATAVQGVLSKFSGMDQSDPKVLERIGRELMPVAPNAGLRALTLARELSVKEKPISVRPGGALVSPTGQVIYERPSEDRQKVIAPGQDIARAAGALGFTIPDDVRNFTTAEWKAIDARLNQDKINAAAASAAKLNFEDPKSRFAAITEVNNQVKPLVTQINNLDQAISIRRNDKSPFSQRLFEQTVSGAFGDAQKAQAEITRLVNTGNLGERVTNTLNMFLTGNIGNSTKEDQLESLNAIRDYVAQQYDTTIRPYRSAAGNKADEIAPLSVQKFDRPKLPEGQGYIPFTVINQYGLKRGQRFKQGNVEAVYNGDGTYTVLKGQ